MSKSPHLNGQSVREGGFSSFRTQPFPKGRTFLCVASCVGYVLGVRTLVVLFRELEWLSPVVRPTVTYVRPHLKLPHLRWLCNEACEETLYHVLLALTLSTKVAFALLALLRLQRGLPRVVFLKKPHQCCYRSSPATSKQFITKHPGRIALKCILHEMLEHVQYRAGLN